MTLKPYISIFLLLLFSWSPTLAQHPNDKKRAEKEVHDSVEVHTMKDFFTKGAMHGHVRNFFMATVNHGLLSDHYANAIGAEIGYTTAYYHNFRLGVAGLFTYNTFSSAIDTKDPLTGKYPRLELELFDVENPANRADLDRLDELYLEYRSERLRAKVGRFSFQSPLINPQDGRMKPYTVQGINLQVPLHSTLLTMAWFDRFSPRSTVNWYRASESIGIYPMGVDAEGARADYHHTFTRGVAVMGIQTQIDKRLHGEFWNFWIDNVSNNSYGRTILRINPQLRAGVEGLYQFRVGNGGNQEQLHAYFPDQKQWLAGAMLAYEPSHWHLSVNYLHIGSEGRFLFPREWGREQFFATLPRGRMEGLGKTDLLAVKARKEWSKTLYAELALSKAWIPDPTDFRYNKYGFDSYWGWVADFNYKPQHPAVKGLGFRLLYVGRTSPNSTLALPAMFYNTNFHNFNFVTQFTF
jgi:hypothetical protein